MNRHLLEKIEQAKRKYEAEGFIILGVFGSYARGEEAYGSDLDILYEVKDDFIKQNIGLDFYFRIEQIKHELSEQTDLAVDLANKNALDKIGNYFILPETIYV